MFRDYWRKIVNKGITPDLEFYIRNKIRIYNSSLFVIGATYLFYTLVGCLRHDYLAAFLTFISWAISAFCLYLVSIRKYALAFHITAGLGMVFLYTFCLLYGESTLTFVYFLFIPVATIVLFDNFTTCLVYFVLTLVAVLTIKVYFLNFQPYYPYQDANTYLGFLNISLTAMLLYLAVRMFKYENLLYSKEISAQRDLIEEKNKDILSSIHYAKRIQRALFASDALLDKYLPEYFVLYKPKDIVSGDFYWAEPVEGGFMLAVCDCTGHGVPGAFMSLLNISFLNEIVMERKITKPEKVFDHLRDDIIRALNPEGTKEEGKDGMDAVLCFFDFSANRIDFACANNPLWLVRNGQLQEFKADKMPIGMYEEKNKTFSPQQLLLEKGDMIYLFTDGYADQFGGEKGKKFKYKQLQQLLLTHANESMERQKELLDKRIEEWKGDLEQVDDILIIGIRIK